MEIKELLTKVNRTVANNRAIKYIVMHYVGGVSTAYNNAKYFENVDRQASAHYFVDDNETYRVVAEKDIAWHCGTTGTYYSECRNSNSIGIEMCCFNNNGALDISESVVNKTIALVKDLMAKYNIPAENVIRHYDVTRKICPAPFVSNTDRWNDFRVKITREIAPKPTETKKSVEELAREVIDGKWANQPERQKRLEAAGYNFSEVQNRVNEILGAKPTPTDITYTVKRGDNLSIIAQKYNTTWQKIYDKNKGVIGSNPNLIYPGQVLKI